MIKCIYMLEKGHRHGVPFLCHKKALNRYDDLKRAMEGGKMVRAKGGARTIEGRLRYKIISLPGEATLPLLIVSAICLKTLPGLPSLSLKKYVWPIGLSYVLLKLSQSTV